MKLLVTGGAGSVGSYLVPRLLEGAHAVRVLDRVKGDLERYANLGLELIEGRMENQDYVGAAVEGVDAIIHLAWSFSGSPLETFDTDVRGYLLLLEAAAARQVKHIIHTSSAVVYGKPRTLPVDETHPCITEDSRSPLYALAKLSVEKVGLIYCRERGLPVTNIRFWWGFGEEIGGKQMRDFIRTAIRGEEVKVPAFAGGSFLHLDDLTRCLERTLLNEGTYGETFNVASFFVTWEQVGQMIEKVVGSGRVVSVPPEDWQGPGFLLDRWEVSCDKALSLIDFKPGRSREAGMELLKNAISHLAGKVRRDM